jgi:hypothetical protein
MKAFILRKTLIMCLNDKDLEIILLGVSRADRYNGEHKAHAHMFPDDIPVSHLEWMATKKEPEIKFIPETNDFDFTLSMFDIKCAFLSVYHVPDGLVPKNPIVNHVKIFFPDATTETGYPTEQRIKGYLATRLRPLKAAA